MIIINNLAKRFNNEYIFKNIDLKINNNGIYGILGPSGCGKSTLLNIISTLDNEYEGEVIIDGQEYQKLSFNARSNFRIKNCGFIFQSFNLIENDTVINNIKLMQDAFTDFSSDIKNSNIEEILEWLDIVNIKDSLIKNLSGGEKQRVAIARALINNPKYIFCDEPTGSLDEKNCRIIFDILNKLSKTKTVIIVSHDDILIKKYADFIYFFDKRELEENKLKSSHDNVNLKIGTINKHSSSRLSFNFIKTNIRNYFKSRKLFYIFTTLIFSFSLVCLGLSLYLSDNILSSVKNSFETIVDNNSLVLKKKNVESEPIIYSASKNEINYIFNSFKKDIEHIGCRYLNNFSLLYKDTNSFYIKDSFQDKILQNLNASSINEFTYININDLKKYDIYPKNIQRNLNNDEIVIGLDYKNMEKICSAIKITKSYESLLEYINNYDLLMVLKVENESWNYYDEQIFKIKGFIKESSIKIYHTNSLFNEYILENMMRMPITLNPFEVTKYPWVLKKIYFFKSKIFPTDLLNRISEINYFKKFVFDSDSSFYSPKNCTVGKQCYSNRIFVYKSLNEIFFPSIIEEIKELNHNFNNYYFSTNYGYMNFGNNIFNGFSLPTYFSMYLEEMEKLENKLEKIEIEEYNNLSFKKSVCRSYAYDTSSYNVKYKNKNDENELDYDEILISRGLFNALKKDRESQELYITINIEKGRNENFYLNKFRRVKLKIKGIVENNSFTIYQNKNFSLYLFRDFFEISALNLIPNGIVYEFENKPNKEEIARINRLITDYKIYDPYEQINESVSEIFDYINMGLLIFTIFSLISTLLLLFVINTINFEDESKTYSTLIMLGFDQININKLLIFKNLSYLLPALFTSIVSIVIVSIFLRKIINNMVNLNIAYIIPISSIVIVIILTILIALISFLFSVVILKNKKMQDYLH